MKRIITLLLLLIFLLCLSGPAHGSEASLDYVADYAGLLTDQEAAELDNWLREYRTELQLDIVIVTTYGTGGKGVQAYANDFYDRNGYGYGSSKTGILLLIDMESREWYMSTCGEAICIFTDYALDQLGQEILPWLSDGEYYRAFLAWVSALPSYVKAYQAASPVDGYVAPDEYDSPYGEEIYYYDDHGGTSVKPFPIALVMGLVAALVTILVMRSQMNTAKLQKNAANYLKEGSFRLRRRSDMFLYSRVSRRAKPKNNTSGGGGSSVHRSSGGVSHGGRGGRF